MMKFEIDYFVFEVLLVKRMNLIYRNLILRMAFLSLKMLQRQLDLNSILILSFEYFLIVVPNIQPYKSFKK